MMMPSIFGERFFDDLFDDFAIPEFRAPQAHRPEGPRGMHPMKTDVKEKEDHFEITIDLPGFKKEDVTAELKDGYLTVAAKHTEENETKDEDGRFIRHERYSGSMQRSFYVGEAVSEQDIAGRLEDGTLHLSVPKKEPKKLEDTRRFVAIEG